MYLSLFWLKSSLWLASLSPRAATSSTEASTSSLMSWLCCTLWRYELISMKWWKATCKWYEMLWSGFLVYRYFHYSSALRWSSDKDNKYMLDIFSLQFHCTWIWQAAVRDEVTPLYIFFSASHLFPFFSPHLGLPDIYRTLHYSTYFRMFFRGL